MSTALHPRRIAAACGLLGVLGLAVVVYAIVTHEPANDGGTSIAGLFFVMALVLAVPALVEAGLLAAVLRWGTPTVWPRRFLVLGAVLGGVGALAVVLWPLTSVVPAGTSLPPFLDWAPNVVFAGLGLCLVGGLAASGVGLVGQAVVELRFRD